MQSPFEPATPTQRKLPKKDKRPFEALKVGFCYAQTAKDRFGDDAVEAIRDRERVSQGINPEGLEMPFIWPSLESDDDPTTQPSSIYRLVPSMQPYRNSLTALSQTYNLYFAAYQSHIFVYVPRSVLRQTLPQQPELQLHTRPTKAAIAIGGVIDRSLPHAINYIITGMLGEEEVVVAAYDDGDVVAYLVKDIADFIFFNKSSCSRRVPNSHKRARSSGPPKPFFHDNVGRSAWGLAVHSKTRLIAVSSNRCEITVFAFALHSCRSNRPFAEPCGCCPNCEVTESGIPRRERNWRIIIVLTSEATNIPHVSFLDNEKGHAEMVCAIDIKGALWMAEIWKMFQPATRIEPNDDPAFRSEEFWPANSRGWGILPIPDEAFMVVNKVDQLFGQDMAIDDTGILRMNHGRPTISLRKCVAAIPSNPFAMPLHRFTEEQIHPGMVMALNNVFLPLIPGAPLAATPDPPTDDGEASETSESEAFGDEEVEEEMALGEEEEQDEGSEFQDEGMEALEEDEETEVDEEEGEDPDVEEDEDEEDEDDDEDEENDEDDDEDEEDDEDEDEENEDGDNQEGTIENGFVTMFVDGVLVTVNNTLASPEVQSQSLHDSGPQHLDDALGQLGNAVQVFEKVMAGVSPTVQGPLEPQEDPCDVSMFRLEMAFFPHNGRLQAIPNRASSKLLQFLCRPVEYNLNLSNAKLDEAWDRILQLSSRYRFLRTYEKDLELMSFEKDPGGQAEYSMICPDVLRLGAGFHERGSRSHFRATSRISMVAHVPELSLVVVGSPIGRVLLMTPTKLSKQAEHSLDTDFGYAEHGLRLDWILPFKDDEAVHRPREAARPLHGMAIGPVQCDEVHLSGREDNEAAIPRRYRLMLHYRDHSILTYELTRDVQTGKLCLF